MNEKKNIRIRLEPLESRERVGEGEMERKGGYIHTSFEWDRWLQLNFNHAQK